MGIPFILVLIGRLLFTKLCNLDITRIGNSIDSLGTESKDVFRRYS